MGGKTDGNEDPNEFVRQEIPLKRSEGLVLLMNTPKGRGVFASKNLPARTVLEVSPVLVLDPAENEQHIRATELYNYTYNWPYTPPTNKDTSIDATVKSPTTTQAIILGLGSMFNHSTMHQNVGWERDIENLLITYTALRDIKAGEELCISYGSRLTFKDSDEVGSESENEDWTEKMNVNDLID